MHDLPEISKPLYLLAIGVWVASLVLVSLSFVWDLNGLYFLFFPAIMVEMVWSREYQRDAAASVKRGERDAFGRIVNGVNIVAIVLFAVSFMALFNGGPDVVDGAYVRTSHGEIVASLTQQEWQLLSLCERLIMSLACLVFSSNLLDGIYVRYRRQQVPKEKSRC